ncbi:MFS transporter [Gordonia humi]|uniref:EmrB/QacA subfamily drug resistance transporter n=1 Tax=Gordonia humi TaxID=686429 RepID=A0A840FD64_9ACTN|nr:MFS transporter [Gordonia humi]MBB4138060.1 EmrB/QacA subfamily drug resistance transporter [Gordonia humi]
MAELHAGSPANVITEPKPARRRWWVLGLIALVQLMLALDASVVNVALPKVQETLSISDASRQWAVTAYALTFGGLLLLGGRIADFAGRKRVLLVGLVGFVAASALGGLATTASVLFAARGLQGAFAALMAPAGLAILSVTFTRARERGTAFGVYGAVSGAGVAIGLTVGGLLTQYTSWRWCLLINVPVGVIAAMICFVVLTESKAAGRARYDVPGAVTATFGLMSLIFGITKGQEKGWTDSSTLGALATAAVLLVAFVAIEARSTRPLLPLRILLHRSRSGAYLASLLSGAALFSIFLFLSYYMQGVSGYSPVRTGLAFLPSALGVGIGSGIAGRLMGRLTPRAVAVAGLVTTAAGMFLLTGLDLSSGYVVHLLPGEVVTAVGCGLVFVTAPSAAMTDIAETDSGAASALVNTAQQIGGSLGIAVLGAIAASITTGHLATHPGDISAATVQGFRAAFLAGGIALAVGAVIVAVLIGRSEPAHLNSIETHRS